MKHLIIYFILLFMVAGFIVYKAFEVFINVPLGENEKINHQLDMFGVKRLLLNKIPF